MPRVHLGGVERRGAAPDPERPGRLDAQLRPERRSTAYIGKDPAHYHAFYATTAYPISLVFDTTQYPYNIVAFRKALSYAINRSDVSKLGEYGYAPPTDALGMNGIFPTWVTGATKRLRRSGATYNPTLAKKTLTDAGFTYKGSDLIDPKGNPVNLDIHVISGWSDWVASNQIITKNLQAIGINSKVALEPDWNSWYPNASATKNPSLLWQNASQASPYGFFNSNMSTEPYTPSGQDATNTGNWAHYSNAQATALLNQWKATLDVDEAASDRCASSPRSSCGPADRPAVRRAAVVDVQHEVLPLLHVTEELLRGPDLHARPPTTSSRSRGFAPAARPARNDEVAGPSMKADCGRDIASRPRRL